MKYFNYFIPLGLAYQSFGKTGNTAIINVLFNMMRNIGSPIDLRPEETIHKAMYSSSLVNTVNIEDSKLPHDTRYIISIRNPFTKILSLYLHITANGRKPLNKNWQNKLKTEGLPSFLEFLKILEDLGVDNIDGHTMSVANNSCILKADYDYVIRFECFNYDLGRLIANEGFSGELKIEQKGVRTNSNNKIYSYYSDESVNLVTKLYNDDFDVLGYSKKLELAGRPPLLRKVNKSLTDLYLCP